MLISNHVLEDKKLLYSAAEIVGIKILGLEIATILLLTEQTKRILTLFL